MGPIGMVVAGENDSGEAVAAVPGMASLISPEGSIDTRKPTYTWNEVEDSLWYLLSVGNSSGVVIEQWYKASDVTSGATCSATPPISLSSGKYNWRIRTWNCDGYGPWSGSVSFSVCVSVAKPRRATLISPRGTIGTLTPAFVWNPVADSGRYCLKITGPSGYAFIEWFDAEDVTADTVCELDSPETLSPGEYAWQIRTGNCIGDGPWSAITKFTITDKAPARVSTISPKGLVSTRTPIFTWSSVPGSTKYRLWVENDTEIIIDVTFTAEKVTSGYRCRVISPMILPDDDVDFFWRVQASNDIGNGPWSSYKYFETVCGTNSILKEQEVKEKDMKGVNGREKLSNGKIKRERNDDVTKDSDKNSCGCGGDKASS